MKIKIIACIVLLCTTMYVQPVAHKITTLLNAYKRPFSVLTLAQDNDIAYQIAKRYPESVCIFFDTTVQEELKNITILHTPIIPTKLQHLSDAEHIDVVIASDVKKLYPHSWKDVVQTLQNFGDYTFITTKEDEVVKHITNNNFKHLQNNLYYTTQTKQEMLRKTWFHKLKNHKKTQREIVSNFTEKKLLKYSRKKEPITSTWHPGINSLSFKMCRGIYPNIETFTTKLYELKNVDTDDWMPYNTIVSGTNLIMIDLPQTKHTCRNQFCQTRYNIICDFFKLESSDKELEHFYRQTVLRINQRLQKK